MPAPRVHGAVPAAGTPRRKAANVLGLGPSRAQAAHGTALAVLRPVHRCRVRPSVVFVLLAGAAHGAVAAAPRVSAPELVLGWQPNVAGRRDLTAVAYDPATGRAALGSPRGVVLTAPGGRVLEVLSQPDVTALAFRPDGSLLVGTAHGLFRHAGGGALEDCSPVPGEEGRAIARLASCGSVSAAATGAGVYVSGDGRQWQTVPGVTAHAAAAAVALWCQPRAVELRAIAAGDVWRATLGTDGTPQAAAVSVAGLDASVRAQAQDVLLEADGIELVLAPDRVALHAPEEDDWRVVRPVLAPGTNVLRLAAAAGRRWIATDRGLFAAGAELSFTRLPPDGALAAVRDVAGDETRVLAATDEGLLEGHFAVPAAVDTAGARASARRALEPAGRTEPVVEEVFRAALDYLSLRPEEIRNLRRGLAARGLLPQLELRLQRGRSRDADAADDESFVSGEVRRLHDRRTASAHEAIASFYATWELGDLAFAADAIDLSKEARAVIQLRDDVLDEITHLYFERRRVLLELAALDPQEGTVETERLRLRADELAAGLDAWTGGWFSQHVPAAAP